MAKFFGVLLALLTAVAATPLERRQSPAQISSAQINSYTPYTHYASTGYCAAGTTKNWSCGANCNANPTFKPVASGGDGSSVQYWFVGYDPTLKTVIVGHQGTDPSKIEPLVTDGNAFLTTLDSSLFPGLSSSIEVHKGFANAQAKAATSVLSAVRSALSANGASKVTVVGHSLGSAIALLDSVYLKLQLSSSVQIVTIGYSMPRVGNKAFADWVDSHLSLTHINNREDPIPISPGRGLGYTHPSGEIHIQDSGAWYACPGQDNTSNLCIVGDVPNIFVGHINDHDGPFNGIEMGC